MKRSFLITMLLLGLGMASAQERNPMLLRVEARGDYQREYVDGTADRSASGFKGKFLNVILKGDFAGKFSYAYRQRLNRASLSGNFFDATDWLYLDYRPVAGLTLSAGKQVVGIGGYEYDRAPIEMYFCSEYWNNIACYQWGVSAAYDLSHTSAARADRLLLQVCQSPMSGAVNPYNGTRFDDLYAYNIMWYGTHGFWSTMWSANMIEYSRGRFISYLALGNEFRFARNVWLQADFMNRASSHQRYFFDNFSVIGELNYKPSPCLRLFAKATYDKNATRTQADLCVHPGTDITRAGAGFEVWPVSGKYHDAVRLHANYSYTWGVNGNPDGALHDKGQQFNVGLTCRLDAIKR